MGNVTLDYAPGRRMSWRLRLGLGSAAGVVGLITSFVGLVSAGHGGPIWPAALFGGPWVGPVWLLGRMVSLPPAGFLALHFGAGALGYVGYVWLLIGPLRRFGYLRGIIFITAFHACGVIGTLAIGWWLSA